MAAEKMRVHSRWMLRVLEWNDPRAKYPNLWHGGMPVHVLAFDTVAKRLRLGDLIAVYHPAVQVGDKKQGAFLGLSRVIGLRESHSDDQYWIDLETAHRLAAPLVPDKAPRRVFLCCDPEWPGPDVALFRQLFDAALADGWNPATGDQEVGGETPEPEPEPEPESEPEAGGRRFCGAVLGGGLHDRREHTWIAMVRLTGDGNPGLKVTRLEATGRSGLAGLLRSSDQGVVAAEGIGLSFPFGMPLPFAEAVHGGAYPEAGWWDLVRSLERWSYPDFLEKIQEFQKEHGETLRHTDQKQGAGSSLRRNHPDLGSVTYHGIRMLAEGRSRFAVRPFESAEGRLLFEVRPPLEILDLNETTVDAVAQWSTGIEAKLSGLGQLPVTLDRSALKACRGSSTALKAVLAARQAAAAVLSGEVSRTPEELDPEEADRIRKEGWIYG